MTASEHCYPKCYDFKLAKSASACTSSSSSGQGSSKRSIYGDRDGNDVMSEKDLQRAIARNEAIQLFLGAAGVYDPLVREGLKWSNAVLKKYRDEGDIGKQSSFEGDDSWTRTR